MSFSIVILSGNAPHGLVGKGFDFLLARSGKESGGLGIATHQPHREISDMPVVSRCESYGFVCLCHVRISLLSNIYGSKGYLFLKGRALTNR